ncbi:MAG: hypothetical protein MZV63_14810 [Marinilabiliales bacterium]|nr:hypothetical protein [Marinilabiliales bacterium]
MNNDKEIDVDKAWNKLYSRLSENGLITETSLSGQVLSEAHIMRIAAVALLMLGIWVRNTIYMNNEASSAKNHQ